MQCVGSKIVSGGSEGRVKEWNLESRDLLRQLVTTDAVWRVRYVDGRIAAGSSAGQTSPFV